MLSFAITDTWDGRALPVDQRVTVLVSTHPDGLQLHVKAPYNADHAPANSPGSTPGLWKYEVVEWFLLGAEDRYLEIELGPHGHYLVLQLHGRRNPVRQGMPLAFVSHIDGSVWHGTAVIPAAWIPPGPHRANAAAIRGTGEDRTYSSSAPLPGSEPDFHRLECFVEVTLPPPGTPLP